MLRKKTCGVIPLVATRGQSRALYQQVHPLYFSRSNVSHQSKWQMNPVGESVIKNKLKEKWCETCDEERGRGAVIKKHKDGVWLTDEVILGFAAVGILSILSPAGNRDSDQLSNCRLFLHITHLSSHQWNLGSFLLSCIFFSPPPPLLPPPTQPPHSIYLGKSTLIQRLTIAKLKVSLCPSLKRACHVLLEEALINRDQRCHRGPFASDTVPSAHVFYFPLSHFFSSSGRMPVFK